MILYMETAIRGEKTLPNSSNTRLNENKLDKKKFFNFQN